MPGAPDLSRPVAFYGLSRKIRPSDVRPYRRLVVTRVNGRPYRGSVQVVVSIFQHTRSDDLQKKVFPYWAEGKIKKIPPFSRRTNTRNNSTRRDYLSRRRFADEFPHPQPPGTGPFNFCYNGFHVPFSFTYTRTRCNFDGDNRKSARRERGGGQRPTACVEPRDHDYRGTRGTVVS